MGYEINLGNGEWATGQGGMAMTVTDTDTGVKEAILMGCNRNAPKTAENKDGLLYDVLPYEPSVTYIDGVGVLNNEPQATQLFTYTNFSDVTENSFKYRGDSGLFIGKNNLNLTSDGSNRETLDKTILADAQSTYYYSVFFESSENNINLNQMIVPLSKPAGSVSSFSIDGGKTFGDIGNEIPSFDSNTRIVVKVETSTTSGNIVFRVGVGCISQTIASSISVSSPQIEKDSMTSFIVNESGSTQTRLEDTGFQTPDISKWVDSSSFSFEASIEMTDISSNQISLSDGTSSNKIVLFLFSNSAYGIRGTVNGVDYAVSNNIPADTLSKNNLRFEVIGNSFKFYLNNIEAYSTIMGSSFSAESMKYLKLSDSTNTNNVKANISYIKITL